MSRSAVARALVLVTVLGALVFAAPASVLAVYSNCGDVTAVTRHQGMDKHPSGTGSITYVSTQLRVQGIYDHFGPCSQNPGTFNHDGAGAWIGIQPEPGKTGILQAGIISCSDDGVDGCFGRGHGEWFVAVKGCLLTNDWWWPGPAADERLGVTIKRNNTVSPVRWEVKIGTVTYWTMPESDSRISCWITGDTYAMWHTETWDRGDAVGHYNSTTGTDRRTKFESARYAVEHGSIVEPGWVASNPCTLDQEGSGGNRHQCDVRSGDDVYLWSIGAA